MRYTRRNNRSLIEKPKTEIFDLVELDRRKYDKEYVVFTDLITRNKFAVPIDIIKDIFSYLPPQGRSKSAILDECVMREIVEKKKIHNFYKKVIECERW